MWKQKYSFRVSQFTGKVGEKGFKKNNRFLVQMNDI